MGSLPWMNGKTFSLLAKHAASDPASGKDKYTRTLADVLLLDGSNLNHTLVKNGWCWWYGTYAPKNTELARLEQNARETQQGL